MLEHINYATKKMIDVKTLVFKVRSTFATHIDIDICYRDFSLVKNPVFEASNGMEIILSDRDEIDGDNIFLDKNSLSEKTLHVSAEDSKARDLYRRDINDALTEFVEFYSMIIHFYLERIKTTSKYYLEFGVLKSPEYISHLIDDLMREYNYEMHLGLEEKDHTYCSYDYKEEADEQELIYKQYAKKVNKDILYMLYKKE